MIPIPNRPVRPGRLTLLVAGSACCSSVRPPFDGPGGLALIIPWLVVLVLHLILGPVALYTSWKQEPSLAAPLIYIYFLVFAGVHAWLFIHGSGLDREVQNVWRRHSTPWKRNCTPRCRNSRCKRPPAWLP